MLQLHSQCDVEFYYVHAIDIRQLELSDLRHCELVERDPA